MTLLLTGMTPEYIVQVSDRRLTLPDGSLFDDNANKAVHFSPNALFTYTGIARIGSTPTDEWITDRLIGRESIQDALDHLTAELDRVVWTQPWSDKRLTVVADIWGSANGGPYCAHSIAITNFCDPVSRKPLATALPSFRHYRQSMPVGKSLAIIPSPVTLQPAIERRFFREFVRAQKAMGRLPDAHTVGRLMAIAIREMASRSGRIGKHLMVNVLYNRTIPQNYGKANQFLYMDASSGAETAYAPNLVTSGLAIKGFKMTKGRSSS